MAIQMWMMRLETAMTEWQTAGRPETGAGWERVCRAVDDAFLRGHLGRGARGPWMPPEPSFLRGTRAKGNRWGDR